MYLIALKKVSVEIECVSAKVTVINMFTPSPRRLMSAFTRSATDSSKPSLLALRGIAPALASKFLFLHQTSFLSPTPRSKDRNQSSHTDDYPPVVRHTQTALGESPRTTCTSCQDSGNAPPQKHTQRLIFTRTSIPPHALTYRSYSYSDILPLGSSGAGEPRSRALATETRI